MNETWAAAKTNRMVLIMNAIIGVALTAGYLIDLVRGRKTVLFVVCYLVAATPTPWRFPHTSSRWQPSAFSLSGSATWAG